MLNRFEVFEAHTPIAVRTDPKVTVELAHTRCAKGCCDNLAIIVHANGVAASVKLDAAAALAFAEAAGLIAQGVHHAESAARG